MNDLKHNCKFDTTIVPYCLITGSEMLKIYFLRGFEMEQLPNLYIVCLRF